VIGVLPGILGSIQANEVIKVISGVGTPLAGRLFQFDAAEFKTRIFNLSRDPDNPLTGLNPTQTELIDYEYFCGLPTDHTDKRTEETPKEIDVNTLQEWMNSGRDFQLIDVREPFEYEIANLGGILIPKGIIPGQLSRLDRNKEVVVYCRSGKRSMDVVNQLRREAGYSNLINLKGGILAWAKEIDPEMPVY
jgi:adenylyltransferase/sulfurtransferase